MVLLLTILFVALVHLQQIEASQKIPQRSVKRFINLTNGMEVIPQLLTSGISFDDLNWIRIQSTHCENTNYYGIMESLDANFLMNVAVGNVCLIFDYGSRGTGQLIGTDDHRYGIPRSYWWGIEWIRHCLSFVWKLEEANSQQRFVRGYNAKNIFDEQLLQMPKTLQRRLKYYRPYVLTRALHIYPIYSRTSNDGEKTFYHDLMRQLQTSSEFKNPCSSVSDEEVERWVLSNALPPGFHLYRSSDFLGLGRQAQPVSSPIQPSQI